MSGPIEALAVRVTPDVMRTLRDAPDQTATVEDLAKQLELDPSVVALALKRAERHGNVVLEHSTHRVRVA